MSETLATTFESPSESPTTWYNHMQNTPKSAFAKVVSYKKAIAQIRCRMKSCFTVAIYSFNIDEDELKWANALLDKLQGRKSMRVSYNDDFNFVVKYMPSAAHEMAHAHWISAFESSLRVLGGTNDTTTLGYGLLGATTFELSPNKHKQADVAISPSDALDSPTIVLEVGDSESLTQLKIDARLWIESKTLNVQLVVIICIDPPLQQSNLPQIMIQHWRSFPPSRPLRSRDARTKEARMVWQADWTNGVTPGYYVLLSDVFLPGTIPVVYGNAVQVTFQPTELGRLRDIIINRWHAAHSS